MDLVIHYMFNSLRIATLILLTWSIPVLGLAETVYVGDSLRVGVRAEPNNSTAPHGVVLTGMQLEVLDRANGFVKIHGPGGVEGWIKDSYVTTEKPAKLELTQVQAEQAKLRKQLADQDKALKDATARASSLSSEVDSLKRENSELRGQLAESKQGKVAQVSRFYIGYAVFLLILGAGGVVIGVRWQRKQAMKRLGGLRV
jgi:uncharacterized protein YgiM (DUF1202 family)